MLDFVRVEGSKTGENGIWCRTRVATFKVRLVVAQRKKASCRITLYADDETPAELVGDEVSFMVYPS